MKWAARNRPSIVPEIQGRWRDDHIALWRVRVQTCLFILTTPVTLQNLADVDKFAKKMNLKNLPSTRFWPSAAPVGAALGTGVGRAGDVAICRTFEPTVVRFKPTSKIALKGRRSPRKSITKKEKKNTHMIIKYIKIQANKAPRCPQSKYNIWTLDHIQMLNP